ncbi:hypothetical protein G5C51_04655 [Streptomyces sp. A7024]|uniref:Uncharacterized protein n=1 Tax=Streptomyces coryli TaxID=1128680 RepID=A0A6G4TT49_9ACTN|nr:hypothetical protein [Streptomyces coryli]NGN63199.1 hypothetical protein [Streptomyces coryli]
MWFTRRDAQPALHACADLDGIELPFGPLTTELLAALTHVKKIDFLAGREVCPEEYQRVAHALVRILLDGWQQQTDGRGRIEDLLASPPTGMEPSREHAYANPAGAAWQPTQRWA